MDSFVFLKVTLSDEVIFIFDLSVILVALFQVIYSYRVNNELCRNIKFSKPARRAHKVKDQKESAFCVTKLEEVS